MFRKRHKLLISMITYGAIERNVIGLTLFGIQPYAYYLTPNSHNHCRNQDKAPRTHLVVI